MKQVLKSYKSRVDENKFKATFYPLSESVMVKAHILFLSLTGIFLVLEITTTEVVWQPHSKSITKI